MTLFEILDVYLPEPHDDRLWGCYIDAPKPGSKIDNHSLELVGWVVGRSAPAVAVELVHEGAVLRQVALNDRRPDIAAAYPKIQGVERSGFWTVVSVLGMREIAVEVQAVLQDQSQVPIGMIRGRNISTEILNPKLSALMKDQEYWSPVGRIDFGELRRVTPISRTWGFDRGVPIDRYYIENFLANHTDDILGRVLEVGDNSYTRKFGGNHVTISDVLDVVEGNRQATIIGDLTCADHIPSDTFDCVIVTQTLHIVFNMRAALQTLYRILKPGGVLLATFPGISRIEGSERCPCWYWGFTTSSAVRLLEEAFPAENVRVSAQGNVLSAISFLLGLAVEDLSREELDYHDPDYEVLITVRSVKPERLDS